MVFSVSLIGYDIFAGSKKAPIWVLYYCNDLLILSGILRQSPITRHAHQLRRVEFFDLHRLLIPQIAGDRLPDGLAGGLRAHRGPAGDHIVFVGFDLAAVVEGHVGDALTEIGTRFADIVETAQAHHVAALLVVGVLVEEVVADVFENRFDLAPFHLPAVGLRIGDAGLVHDVIQGDLLPRQYGGAPAEAG